MERYLSAPYDPALGPDDRLLAFLDKLARNAANQAFSALLFLFRDVLVRPLEGLQDTVRARRGPKLPVVFSRDEVQRLFAVMEGTTKLMGQLVYGAGLRLMECITLRVKDIDFDQRRVFVRSGKGDKDRSTLPASLRLSYPAETGVIPFGNMMRNAPTQQSPERSDGAIRAYAASLALRWQPRHSRPLRGLCSGL